MLQRQEGLELSELRQWMMWFIAVAVWWFITAHSTLERRKIALELHTARVRLNKVQQQNHRLNLELASIQDPEQLSKTAAALGFDQTVTVIDIENRAPFWYDENERRKDND